jgi:hypothetical protein
MAQAKTKKRRRVSNCRQTIAGTKCPGKYQLTYEHGAPIFTCDRCGHEELTWKKFYNEYLQLYSVKENWDNKKDQVSCIIGFFCHMYRDFYGTDYVFVPKNPNPYGAKECKDAWSLLAAFSGDAHEVRKYVYWVFKKGINKNITITHFGYINTPGLIRRYNLYAKRKKILRRESKLPKAFIDWCNTNVPDIFEKYNLETMNDLGAMLSFYKTYSESRNMETEFDVILEAKKSGLITKNGNLNIGEK